MPRLFFFFFCSALAMQHAYFHHFLFRAKWCGVEEDGGAGPGGLVGDDMEDERPVRRELPEDREKRKHKASVDLFNKTKEAQMAGNKSILSPK